MARTEQEIASDINAKNEVKILEALKDYFAKKYNTNFENIKLNLDAIKNALSGLSGVTQHLGVPHVPSSTAPTNPNEYDWYFDTSDNSFKMYHNSAWTVIADLANLINLDAKYLQISDAASQYATSNELTVGLAGKADAATTYSKTEVNDLLGTKQGKLSPEQLELLENDAFKFTQSYKEKLDNAITSSTQQDISGKADISYVDSQLAGKQDNLNDDQKLVINAHPFTTEAANKITTNTQSIADINSKIQNYWTKSETYNRSEIDSKVEGAAGQFKKGTIKDLTDSVNGIGVTDSEKKVLTIDDLKEMVKNQNLINKGTFVNFVDKVIYKDSTTLEYFDTVLNIEVKDAAAVTTGTVMALTHTLDVYGRISVEGTSFGAEFKSPCSVEYNFMDSTKNKGVKFTGTPGQDYKWELFSKYEGDQKVNFVRFSGTSSMMVTDNPGASATWASVTMPHEVRMDTLFDASKRDAQINIDFTTLPADGTNILNLEYFTTIPYLETRFGQIIAQLQNDITNAQPNFTDEQKAVLAANAFTDAYKGKLDNAPDNINTELTGKLDVSTYNTDKATFLTSASIAGKADTNYVDTELGKKQVKLSDDQIAVTNGVPFTSTLKTKYDGYATTIASKADAATTTTAIGAKADKAYVDTQLAGKQAKLSTEQLALLGTGAIKYTQAADDRITANHSDIVLLKGKGAFLGKFADATARDAALAGTTLVNGDYVILGDPAVRWVYDLRTTSWIEDISHSAAISSITLQDVAGAQDPKIATAKQEAITSANTHTDNAITTLTNTVNGKQDAIDAGKLALLDGAVKYTAADKALVGSALQSHQDISGKADTSYVNTELAKKADKSYVDTQLGGKVATSTYNSKMSQLDTAISGKASTNDLNTKANTSLNNVRVNGHGNKWMYVNEQGYVTYVDLPTIPDVSNLETTTEVDRKIGSKFTQQADKLTSNNVGTLPGDAHIGHEYKGTQSYGEGASIQHYGKNAVNSVNIGEGSTNEINIGKNATGALTVGTTSALASPASQRLVSGTKAATFENIIDVANANPFTNTYKSKVDTALQPSAIVGKVDQSTLTAALRQKQDVLTNDDKIAISKLSFTDAEKSKVDTAVQPVTLHNYYTSAQVNTELAKKQNVIGNLENRLLNNSSNASTGVFRKTSKFSTQTYIDTNGAYVGSFSADGGKYATVKLDGTTPKLFGHNGATQYDIPFDNIQTKLTNEQLAVTNGNTFTNSYKTKLDSAASTNDVAGKANKDLSNVVTDQEKAAFISNLQRIGVHTTLFNEFKGVLASDPAGTHNDLDWYINDSTYEIKVWHNNGWHNIGRPTHALSKAEVMTALGLTQSDIDNLKHFTQFRNKIDLAINHAAKFSHLPNDTIAELAKKADKTYVDGKLTEKVSVSAYNSKMHQLDTSISSKASVNALSGKANVNDVYTKTQSDGKYATKTSLTSGLSGKLDTSTFNTAYAAINSGLQGAVTYDDFTPIENKVNSITPAMIANAKLDHSVYALKSEIPTKVDIGNSVYYIDGTVAISDSTFSAWSTFGAEVLLPNNLKIYSSIFLGSKDFIMNHAIDDKRGVELKIPPVVFGGERWITLGRIKPGGHGAKYAFDLMGYQEADGGISKLKWANGGAPNSSGWSYVKSKVTLHAIAVPSKKWADVFVKNIEFHSKNINYSVGEAYKKATDNATKLSSINLDKRMYVVFDDGGTEDFKVGS